MAEHNDGQSDHRLSNRMLYLLVGGCAAVGVALVAMAGGDLFGEFGRVRFGETASRYVSLVAGGAGGTLVGMVVSSVIWHAKK